MGLDMYLTGRKFFWNLDNSAPKEDGFEVEEIIVKLGYWRKHPNLHGFIVDTFAEGKDECQQIELTLENLETIIEAVKTRQLPKNRTGFFFGESINSDNPEDPEVKAEMDNDLEQLGRAVAWLGRLKPDKSVSLSVTYRASW